MDIDETPVSGTWLRHIPAGGDVYYEPPHPADNRWQRGSVIEALYFADTEDTVWAEWYRFLAEAGLPPKQGLPRDLWTWEISPPRVADLSDNDRLARVRLPELEPTRGQWPTFQPVGEQLYQDGWPALVCASAARPVGRVLCIFRTAREVPGTEPTPPPTTVDERRSCRWAFEPDGHELPSHMTCELAELAEVRNGLPLWSCTRHSQSQSRVWTMILEPTRGRPRIPKAGVPASGSPAG